MRAQLPTTRNPNSSTSPSSPQPTRASTSSQQSCSTIQEAHQSPLQHRNLTLPTIPSPPPSQTISLTTSPSQPTPPPPTTTTNPSEIVATPIPTHLTKKMTRQGLNWTAVPQNPNAKGTASSIPGKAEQTDKGKAIQTHLPEHSIHDVHSVELTGRKNDPTDILITKSQMGQTVQHPSTQIHFGGQMKFGVPTGQTQFMGTGGIGK
ncbi:putative uncharacterized protein DDB_G0290521 [Papaver somniferum]|uniref:putative uncharacterized protein DDB_G0290521 n=1 Tax=Papaver somniferum TaxID=3469 RepID=UPI000E7047F2|nr:putative uncharacterized protein DDB_G0290521 [Papaver somniferum]